MDLSPGVIIGGRYRVDTRVGAGAMGEVWAGEHLLIGVRVAVKTLLPAVTTTHEIVARFRREAYLLGRIRSDNVARVLDFVTDQQLGLVLVMDFVEGASLATVLRDRSLTVEEAIDLGIGLANALNDLHAVSIIHRDLKPGNIILAPLPNGQSRPVLVDFGVSRQMTSNSRNEDEELTGITRVDMAVGTLEYMAPEQILNSRNVTPASDIYAAGAMLFRAVAGAHIYGATTNDVALAQQKLTTDPPPLPMTRTDPVAAGFVEVVGRMVKRRPSERYKTADEVLRDLHALRDLASKPKAEPRAPSRPSLPSMPEPPPSAPVPSPGQRGVPILVFVAAMLLALMIGFSLGLRLSHHSAFSPLSFQRG